MRVSALVRRLTLFDSVMLVVSGTIGASIFITPADVLHAVPDPRFALLLWVVAGMGGTINLIVGKATYERHRPAQDQPPQQRPANDCEQAFVAKRWHGGLLVRAAHRRASYEPRHRMPTEAFASSNPTQHP